MRICLILLFLLISGINYALGEDTKFIFRNKCINILYRPAIIYFNNSEIRVYRDSRGIILRFELKNVKEEYKKLTGDTINKILKVQDFLAKIKNPAIIEVHVSDILFEDFENLKKWEISAVIAGNIGRIMRTNISQTDRQIFTIGYGEFLPANNTSNNGGKNLNRVDIIILCNINGE
jgi:flagellar motor protein MotB